MFVSLVFFSLLFAGRAVCDDDDDWFEEKEDQENFATDYLTQYHYISPTRSGNHNTTVAIENFQKFFGLPVTGELDEDTLDEMKKPRCGVPDVDINDGGQQKRYATLGKWYKTTLKYYLTYGDDMSHDHQAKIIARAFKYWSDVAPRLQFAKTNDLGQADLRISFGKGTHHGVPGERQCAYPFDGPGKVLAHAYFPSDGRIHFDNEEYYTESGKSSGWWWGKKTSQSLIYVAVHEIGHALGLKHSNVKGSVMWPTAKTGWPTLHQDDINGIRSLYG
ncbi:collagenase 3-like [Oculina patagonica]